MDKSLFLRLMHCRKTSVNEEELRIRWIRELSNALDIELQAERGHLDSSYNNVVIEFKSPGSFNGRVTSKPFQEAIYDRLKPYILKKSQEEGLEPDSYIGIAIDGDHVCFAQVTKDEITHGELLPLTPESVLMVTTALRDSFRRAITTENLVEDFGLNSNSGVLLMQALANALTGSLNDSKNNKIKMLFEEWRTLYGQVADLSNNQINGILNSIGFRISLKIKELEIPSALFVLHTYNSLIIKLLASEIICAHGLISRREFAQYVAMLDNDQLLNEIKEQVEKAGLFNAAGITGFIEEAIFSWYLDACSDNNHREDILTALKQTLVKLSFYRTNKLTIARTKDVLKGFYQALIPDDLRKTLGEFYTPDWLVEFTLNKVNDIDWLNDRFLDPTCGSGSFLLELIRRVRKKAEEVNLSIEETVKILTTHIWGFDLNPLAVQTSRVNFLIAIADLLKVCPGQQIELPVLLADAIYSPAQNPDGDSKIVEYVIGSQVANLKIQIPATLAFDRKRLDKIFEIMGKQVEKNASFDETNNRLVRIGAITDEEAKDWEASLRVTYERILELHKKNWNGIWFRIVRNFFWSATAGTFDVVVGNPPWVRWSKLPELYRTRVKPTCLKYDIFSSTPHHGGNELDISGMIIYTVADKWLKTDGKLAFVITQTHFQSPSSEGFRSFSINGTDMLNPISVDDLKALKPFPDAANKTAVALFSKKKGVLPTFPVEYNIWTSKQGVPKVIPPNLSLKEVMERLEVINKEV